MSKKDDKLNKGAEKFSGFKDPRNQHYHITLKGQTLTDSPMHYNDIVKQHGSVSKLESKGFRLVQADPNAAPYSDDTGVTNLKSEDSLNKEQMSGSQRFAHAFMPGRRMGMRSIMRRPQGGIVRKDQISAAAGGQGGDGKPKKPQYFGKPSKEKKQGDKQTKMPSGRDQSHLPKDMKPKTDKKPKTPKMKKDGIDMGKLSAGHKALMGKLKAPAQGGFKSNVGGAQTTPRNFSGGSGQMKATHGGKAATGNQPTSVTRTPTGFKGQSQSGQNVQGSGNGQWTTKQEYKGVGDKIQQTKIPETGSERVMVPIVAEKTKEVVKSDLMEKFSPRFQKGGDLDKQTQSGMPKLDPKGVQGMKDAFKGPDIGGALSSAGSWIKDKFSGPSASEAITGSIKRRLGKDEMTAVVKTDLMEKFSPQFQQAKPTRKPVDMSGVPSPSKPQGRSDKAPAPSQFGNSGFKPRSNSVEKGDVVDFAAAKKKKEDQEQTQQQTQQSSAPRKPTRNMMYPGADGDKIQQALKTHGSLQGNKPEKPAHKEYFGNKLESIKATTGQDLENHESQETSPKDDWFSTQDVSSSDLGDRHSKIKSSLGKINQLMMELKAMHNENENDHDDNKKTEVIKSDLMKEFQPQFQKGWGDSKPKAPTPPANTNIAPTDGAPKGPKLVPKKVKAFMEGFAPGRKKTGQMGTRG